LNKLEKYCKRKENHNKIKNILQGLDIPTEALTILNDNIEKLIEKDYVNLKT
jgi:hypothetical protein